MGDLVIQITIIYTFDGHFQIIGYYFLGKLVFDFCEVIVVGVNVGGDSGHTWKTGTFLKEMTCANLGYQFVL